MHQGYLNAKIQAESAYNSNLGQAGTNAACDTQSPEQASPKHPYSLRDEAAKNEQHHYAEAQKAGAAALFLSQHPEFEEFISLVRQGAIRF